MRELASQDSYEKRKFVCLFLCSNGNWEGRKSDTRDMADLKLSKDIR